MSTCILSCLSIAVEWNCNICCLHSLALLFLYGTLFMNGENIASLSQVVTTLKSRFAIKWTTFSYCLVLSKEQRNIQGRKIEMSNNLDGHNSFYISASDNSKAVLKIFNLKNEWDKAL